MMYNACQLIPVAARSKVWVSVRQLAGIAGSNPAEGHGWMFLVCCWVEVLVMADHLSRGVLLSVVCQNKSVISKPQH